MRIIQRRAGWARSGVSALRPALRALCLPRTLERELAFPLGRPRCRGRREKSRCARCLQPAAQRAPPVEVNSPHPFLSPARPPSARPRRFQPPGSCRSLRSARPLRCPELNPEPGPDPRSALPGSGEALASSLFSLQQNGSQTRWAAQLSRD
ncbi:uncharacterized protein [Eulemur rufifrons]|uniref:uncharacterized protein isoform X1 n=1 Tax=Eulemur rufifrons TaxID=859984 RepID=UPI0037425E90